MSWAVPQHGKTTYVASTGRTLLWFNLELLQIRSVLHGEVFRCCVNLEIDGVNETDSRLGVQHNPTCPPPPLLLSPAGCAGCINTVPLFSSSHLMLVWVTPGPLKRTQMTSVDVLDWPPPKTTRCVHIRGLFLPITRDLYGLESLIPSKYWWLCPDAHIWMGSLAIIHSKQKKVSFVRDPRLNFCLRGISLLCKQTWESPALWLCELCSAPRRRLSASSHIVGSRRRQVIFFCFG